MSLPFSEELPKHALEMTSAEKFLKFSSTIMSRVPPSVSIFFLHESVIESVDSTMRPGVPYANTSLVNSCKKFVETNQMI